MRPAADHPQPQKRRRFENASTGSSRPTAQTQRLLNGTIVLPRQSSSPVQQGNLSPYNSNLSIPRQPLNGQLSHGVSLAHSNGGSPALQTTAFQSTLQNGQLGATNQPLSAPGPFAHSPTQPHPPNLQDMHIPFGNPSTPNQTTTETSQQQQWSSQPPPPTAAGFTESLNAFDDFFPAEGNVGAKPTTASQRRASHPPVNASSMANDIAFPTVLPPLTHGASPPLGGLDPFSNFAPLETPFRNTAPVHPSFLVSNPLRTVPSSSPAGVSTAYPLQISARDITPPMRQKIGPRTANGIPPNQGNGALQDNAAPFSTTSVLPPRPGITPTRNSIGPHRGTVSLRMISPVKKALELFRDGSPIMVALSQTVMQASSLNVPISVQRNRVLDFTGFPTTLNPKFDWLLSLSKNDLDILAWVFVVSKHGRKEEVARRIVSSLRAPLKYRNPAQAKKPGIPTRSDARNASLNTAAAFGGTAQTSRNASARVNMPSLAPAPLLNLRGAGILNNLQRQLGPSSARGTAALSSTSNGRASAHNNRSKQMQNLCSEVLQGYSFNSGENPFNKPMNSPMGTEPYIVFSSMQLSRGSDDPVLRFMTPAPIEASVRPEVEGGDVQVHIRCLRVEVEKPKSEWKQAWPFPATCRVNGHSVTLNQAQRYTNGKLAGRDAATNITPFLRKYKKTGVREVNRVVLRRQASTATAAAGQYVFFAQEVLVLSHETMTKSVVDASDKYWLEYRASLEKKRIITPSTSKFEMARQGVMQFLTDPDGLTVSSMKVSLRCPLALTRIATPVKGRRCQHVQCFDLENFLEYARRSSKFDCPVCNKNTAYPAMLVISPYIEHALATFKDCDEVEINQDGSMVEVERKQTGVASDDDEDSDVKTEPRKFSSRLQGAGAPAPAEVVDLTLDSDEDDGPQNRAAHQTSSVQPEVDNSIIQEVGNHVHIATSSSEVQGSHDENSSPLEQDMFSFRADFCWREPQLTNSFGNARSRIQRTQADGIRENWTSDVIAIDSD